MTLSRLVANQLGNPTGVIGIFAGLLWNRRNAALNDNVFDLLALQPSDRVLDIGFGGGYLLNRMSLVVTNGLLAGVDVSPAVVAYARNRQRKAVQAGKLDLRCAPVESLPYPVDYFTKVCSVNSIFYWRDVDQGISEIERVLAPGGQVVLCFTCRTSIEEKGFAKHLRLYDPEFIALMMAEHGLQAVRTVSSSDKYRHYTSISGKTGN